MINKVQLITYVDRLGGGTLAELRDLLSGLLAGTFGAVHLLPFFDPIDGADAGFDPSDHTRVDPRLGNWQDIGKLADQLGVMADLIVNHISDQSPQFKDYIERGSESPFEGLFLRQDTVFPKGARVEELASIYRPRPGPPFIQVNVRNGEQRTLWATFTPHQIDIDVTHTTGRQYLTRVLQTLADNGVTMIRLDAVGYAIKKPGTSCFMLPETYEFIGALTAEARALGVEVLVEVHSYYQRQIEIARRVDWVYDFALPPLILHAFAFGSAKFLKNWIAIRPPNAITVLDTHDGIGIVDVGADPQNRSEHPGLIPAEDIDRLVEFIHAASGGQSRQATGAAASNLDLYQVNCTFFDAMGADERRYLLARAVQFFLPGIPQVYYVGLFAGRNDMGLLQRSGVGRDINRHYYSRLEIEQNLQRRVVQDLLHLIQLRNEHPAFGGLFELLDSDDRTLRLRWQAGEHFLQLNIEFVTAQWVLDSSSIPSLHALLRSVQAIGSRA